MTIAEKMKVEIKLEGKLETAKNMLYDGVEPAFIAKYTKPPLETIKKLQTKS